MKKKILRKLIKGTNQNFLNVPKEVQQALRLNVGDTVVFIVDINNCVTIKKVEV